jgi:hypothetical protein
MAHKFIDTNSVLFLLVASNFDWRDHVVYEN